MDSLTLNQHLGIAEKAAHIAGNLITGYRGSAGISEKSVSNLVTEADYKAQEAIVATGFYYDRGSMMRKTLKSIEKLFENNIHGIRRFGSAALDLCWVACARFDAYFEYNLSIWDFAAGMLILKEAGGKLNDQKGDKFDLNSTGIAVSNGKFHDRFLKIVSLSS